jgi:hypothetical protein
MRRTSLLQWPIQVGVPVESHATSGTISRVKFTERTTFFTSSLKRSTSSGLIHLDEDDVRSSWRRVPVRRVLSTSLRELFPSIAASIEYLRGGSPVVLYMHGGQTWQTFQSPPLPNVFCTRASTSRRICKYESYAPLSCSGKCDLHGTYQNVQVRLTTDICSNQGEITYPMQVVQRSSERINTQPGTDPV